jgi:hypothetical protein
MDIMRTGWWFRTFCFPYIGNVIIPTDELIFFRGVGLNQQPENMFDYLTVGGDTFSKEHGFL